MSEQSVHEQALFKTFLKWLLEEKGLLLQADRYLHILPEYAYEEAKDVYMRVISDVVRDYCREQFRNTKQITVAGKVFFEAFEIPVLESQIAKSVRDDADNASTKDYLLD